MEDYVSGFKVCTFNLFNYVEPPNAFYEIENIFSEVRWQKKQEWILNQLNEIDADIIGFQEVFSPDSLQELTKKAGFDYFSIVSEPEENSDHILANPPVAMASKFPILSCDPVAVDENLVKSFDLDSGFKFSRTPIRATVQINGFSTVVVYVVHLKSKRSKFDRQFDVDISDEDSVRKYLRDDLQGRWASNIQRGTEAALIYNDFWKMQTEQEQPTIILGDLNDTIESATLQLLVAGGYMDMIGGKYVSSLRDHDKRFLEKFSLYDAHELSTAEKKDKRTATHFFANKGNVLDYVLLSRDFDANNAHCLAEVTAYKAHDQHLQNPNYETDSEASDHAPVSVSIETVY